MTQAQSPSDNPVTTSPEEGAEQLDAAPAPFPKKEVSHHPPPPPSLRFKSALAKGKDAEPLGPALQGNGTPRVASHVMSRRIFTIGPDDTLEHLEEHMAAFRFRHLPVVDNDKVVGLITHRDLLHASSSFLSEKAKERDDIIHKVPARRIMQHELITVRPDEPLADIAKLMWEAKIGCVLVTEENGKLLGIITEADFIRLAHYFLSEKRER